MQKIHIVITSLFGKNVSSVCAVSYTHLDVYKRQNIRLCLSVHLFVYRSISLCVRVASEATDIENILDVLNKQGKGMEYHPSNLMLITPIGCHQQTS